MAVSDTILARMIALHPKLIDLSLDRLWLLLDKLGNPQDHLPPVIHIAGTNGKGSTLAFMEAMLHAAGLSLHRYSSPHLVRFHERISLAGQYIDETALSALLAEVEDIHGGAPITFFEITTAAAMLAFSRSPADILLLETGLGGRDDATNIVKQPAMTLLSSISLDHTEFLGDTVEQIARIKAAIGRSGVPMISTPQSQRVTQVITQYCQQHDIPLILGGRDWYYQRTKTGFDWSNADRKLALPTPGLRGDHQYDNAALATAAAVQLAALLPANDGAKIIPAIAHGITHVHWPGRMQLMPHGRLHVHVTPEIHLWCDGGHNPAAAEALLSFLDTLPQVRLIIGMLKSKDCESFLCTLRGYLTNAQSLTIPQQQASYTALEIATMAQQCQHDSPQLAPAGNIDQAIKNAVRSGGKNIVICGSLYLVGTVLHDNVSGQS